jgi:diguanylate cyclase (GGDEF)-like protein
MVASPPDPRSAEPDLDAGARAPRRAGNAWAERSQVRWLAGILLVNLASSAFDAASQGDTLAFALELRLLLVAPLMLAALVLNLMPINAALQDAASALASFAFIVTVAVIGQYAPEPFASRYLMSALLLLCGVALFGALPWWETKAVTLASLAGFAVVTVTGLKMPPAWANLDLVGLAIPLCFLALKMRWQGDTRLAELRRMRTVDAERAADLRKANIRLWELSNTDSLTGAFNRRYLDQFVQQSSISIVPALWQGVLMIDVDHFKLFNDHGGHTEGDRCLKQIAEALRHAMRSEDDLVIRYGGEEFVVILQDADLTEARQAAERLRKAVHDLKIPHPGLGPGRTVSISIGACALAPEESISDALARADKLLYEAKQAGRDRVAA